MNVYEVHLDHQIEGRKEGTFSSFEKAEKYVIETLKCDPKSMRSYSNYKTWFYSCNHLQYYIQEINVL